MTYSPVSQAALYDYSREAEGVSVKILDEEGTGSKINQAGKT